MKKSIRCFEYSTLRVGDEHFNKKHFEILVKWNDKSKIKYFSVGYNKIIFCHYVGIIQVHDLLIEILPKVDFEISSNKDAEEKELWSNVLLQMLQFSQYHKINSFKEAELRIRYSSLLNFYIDLFLSECELLLKRGLAKKYRTIRDNTKYLKGKLLLKENINKNIIHKEKFFNEFTNYDYNNKYNQIIFKAISILYKFKEYQQFSYRTYKLYNVFIDITDLKNFKKIDFDHIRFDRTTDSYFNAIQLAKLIILNYSPDVSSGNENILSILFDMNDLYEKFVSKLLTVFSDYIINTQKRKNFWENKQIKPDIVIYNKGSVNNKNPIIIDTKWKIPLNNIPSDSDLKQMFVYNEYFDSNNAILLYPSIKKYSSILGIYKKNNKFCQTKYLTLSLNLNNKQLNIKETANNLIQDLNECFI